MSKSIRRRKQYFDRCFNREIYKKEEFSQLDRLRAEIKYVITKRGVVHTDEVYKKLIELWSNAEMRFAVVGESGAGKSTFINAVRGLNADVEELAETGVTETTRAPTTYHFPQIKEIMLCDLPGLGSPEFPNLQEYCVQLELEIYDAFLILSESRFREHDRELAEKISKDLKKPFFFVRTKLDKDVINNSKIGKNEKETKEEILDDLRTNLKDLVRKDEDIFLIDSKSPNKHDFQRLKELISEKLLKENDDDEEDDEIIGLLKNETRDMIELKSRLLKGKVMRAGIFLHFKYFVSTKRKFKESILDKVNGYRNVFGLAKLNSVDHLIKDYFEKTESSEENEIRMVAKNATDFLKKCINDSKEIAIAAI